MKRLRKVFAVAAAAALATALATAAAPAPAYADTSQPLCTNTTFVDGTTKQTKSANYGGNVDLNMTAGTTKFALVECVVSGIPAGATVTSATFDSWSRSGNGAHTLRLHNEPTAWVENTVTWNLLHTYDAAVLSSAPGDADPGNGEWVSLAAPVTGNGTYRWALDVSTTTNQAYGSDDYATHPEDRPRLTINWTPAAVAPVASFTANPASGQAPLAVQFTDTSTNTPTSWAWTFGDGATSTAQSPSHTYAAAGTYTASLTATNAGGSNTATQTIAVSAAPPAAPVASFTANPTSGTAPLAVQFTDTSTGGPTSWAWDFGDGGTSTAQSPAHTYAAAGTFTVSLTASNAGGSNTAQQTVTVSAAPPTIPDEGAGWNRVYSSTFDADNDPLTDWVKYNASTTYPYTGAYGSDPYNCPRSDHMFTAGGSLVLRMSYRTDLPDCGGVKNNVQSYPSTKWYTGGAMLSATYAAVNQQVTMRYRIVYTDPKVAVNPADTTSVRSHDNLPMHFGNSGCWPQNGEIDYVEGTNPTNRSSAVHFGSSCTEVSPSPVVSPAYSTVDFRSTWHVVRAQRSNHVVKVFIDDLTTPKWTYTGDATSVPDVLQRVVIQQECRAAGCPATDATTTQYSVEDQIDYISVANAS